MVHYRMTAFERLLGYSEDLIRKGMNECISSKREGESSQQKVDVVRAVNKLRAEFMTCWRVR